ncbi:ABC transporter permease [Nocardiopsis lambiniae]|uniref:Autoinducer 2 import system permease protein LsrD n=1 Tax=Nocardiopsis lambiniae TaxID=3075539 RepID=A0ABU2M8W2_9ACTN|nr:ABC transporter permease [Nocardiopsis sp. DSM 44743]MDT0329050.1 ABC transporter permease [Nocardiopsis sp. DSM 44743]
MNRPPASLIDTARGLWARTGTTGAVYLALLLLLVLSSVYVASQGRNLFTTANTVDLFTRSSLLGFLAIGQTLVILCRSLDLSVGYVAALSTVVAATTMAGDPSRIPLGIAATLGLAALIGLANGTIVTGLRVNPFIATLGTGLIIKGFLDTNFQGPAGDVPAAFQAFGHTRLGVLPISTLVMVGLAIAAIVFLHRSRTGYHMYAVGGDAEVARLSGVRDRVPVITAHVLCSMTAGVAGLLLAARFGTGSALVYGNGYELEAIAAVVLGGTYLLGGRGGVAGTLAGVFILATLDTVFNVLAVDPFVKDVLRGVIVITAVAIYARGRSSRSAGRVRFPSGGPPPPVPDPSPDPTEPPSEPGDAVPAPITRGGGR